MTLRWRSVLPAALSALVVAAVTTLSAAPAAAAGDRDLDVEVVQSGLEIPWDLQFLPAVGEDLPAGSMLYTERAKRTLTLRLPDGATRTIWTARSGMWSSGETGLMAVEIDRDFATNREFVTCHGFANSSKRDVRVVRWRMNSDFTAASFVGNLVTGLPATTGRHGGCALVKGGGTSLYIGTGDAAVGRNPQNIATGGGKILRVDIRTGEAWPGNRWIASRFPLAQRTYTYGHRNVQGLARRSDGIIFSNEHGSYRDDEINKLSGGSNYGWNPVQRTSGDPTYNETDNSPMTDFSIRGTQKAAAWDSGTPTIASSGIDFIDDASWGSLDGLLAVSALKDKKLRLMRFDAAGGYHGTYVPPELDGTYGRLRAAVLGPDGSLYLTTSNGEDDKILRVTPRPA